SPTGAAAPAVMTPEESHVARSLAALAEAVRRSAGPGLAEAIQHDVDGLVPGVRVVQDRGRAHRYADDPTPGGVVARSRNDHRVPGGPPDPGERPLAVGSDGAGQSRDLGDAASLDAAALER